MQGETKTHLREFQERLSERLRNASGTSRAARLGLAIGDQRWLVDLAEAGEIVPIPTQMTPVPLTRDWFKGLVNLRGTLFGVSDLMRFSCDVFTPVSKESRTSGCIATARKSTNSSASLRSPNSGSASMATSQGSRRSPKPPRAQDPEPPRPGPNPCKRIGCPPA